MKQSKSIGLKLHRFIALNVPTFLVNSLGGSSDCFFLQSLTLADCLSFRQVGFVCVFCIFWLLFGFLCSTRSGLSTLSFPSFLLHNYRRTNLSLGLFSTRWDWWATFDRSPSNLSESTAEQTSDTSIAAFFLIWNVVGGINLLETGFSSVRRHLGHFDSSMMIKNVFKL